MKQTRPTQHQQMRALEDRYLRLETQIKQQRKRVERLKRAVKLALDPKAEFPPNKEAFPLWLEMEAALKELEVADG